VGGNLSMRYSRFLFLSIVLFLPSFSLSAAENTAEIAAIVGNELISEGELEEQLQFLFLSGIFRPEDTLKIDSLKLDLLDQLIKRRVLIEYAQKESIEVLPEEIDEMLELSIEDMKSRFPDEETFFKYLEEEGVTLLSLKENYKRQIEDNIFLQKLMQHEFGTEMFVTEKEIEEFYTTNRDSFAEPIRVDIAHIFIIPKPSKSEQNRIQNKINEVFLRLEFNEDFGSLAKRYSDGKMKNKGGDLGFVTKDDLPEEIADIAFSLPVGELTLAQGMEGFHLLKCVGEKDDKKHIKQILFKMKITSQDTVRAQNKANNIRKRALSGEDFTTLVKKYSDDIASIDSAGIIVKDNILDALPPLFRNAVKDLEEGGISEVVKTNFGFHIFKVVKKPEPRIPELEEIRNLVKEYIIQKRTKEKTDELLERIISDFYVENLLKEKQNP
jgi:peptidyl-prolyl cis-trans isomerase SurA